MADKVPRLMPGVDIRKFKLDAMDGFLLTRIDGKLDPKGLARDTGLPDFSVSRALEKMEKLGIIEIVAPDAAPPPPPSVGRGATPAAATAPAAAAPQRKSAIAQFDDGLLAPKYDPSELDEPADLQLGQKKRILDFYYRLDDLDHYTLLGLTSDADKKSVKRAYFEFAAIFHPDRYYKKELGSFKPKMEVLFNRITEAHDTLVDRDKRAEYDAYLAEVATTRGMEAMLERAIAESARMAAAAPAPAEEPPAASPVITSAAPPPVVTRPPPGAAGPSAEEIRARKEALARRLTAGRKVTPPAVERPNPLKYTNTNDAMDALKRRYENRIESAAQAQVQRYVTSAEDALAKNDLVAASTAFNIASKFAPDDAALAQRAQEMKQRADELLCESYLKQAQYEERQGHWAESARSWVKVAKIKNDATSHERAAHALLCSPEADLHLAADHAKQAIALQPGNPANHVTLVEIYLKAGLTTSARRAADAVLQLDPANTAVQALLKTVGKA
jgi:curved DNA-binding protein CbpA